MSFFNQIKKFSQDADITPNNIDAEYLNLYTLLNKYFTEPSNWTPTITSTMTLASPSIEWARYCIIGKRLFFDVRLSVTTSGAAGTTISFTAPPGLKPIATVSIGDGCRVGDVTSLSGTWRWNTSTEVIDVSRYDGANWGLGANKVIIISNSYEINK